MKITSLQWEFDPVSHFHVVPKPIAMLQDMRIRHAKAAIDKVG